MSAVDTVVLTSPRARRRRLLRKRFFRRRMAVAGLVVVLGFVTAAIFAPLLAPYGAGATDFNALLAHPSGKHLLGTDYLGRDILSRTLWGARASIQAGFFATMLALREEDYVPAAIANGAGDGTIIFRHILPNMTSTLIVQATVTIPAAIVGEAVLSFLGLGVQPPTPSWGTMLQDAQSYLTQAPRLAVYPGLAIVLAALAFNVLGDGLRDILDPRTTR